MEEPVHHITFTMHRFCSPNGELGSPTADTANAVIQNNTLPVWTHQRSGDSVNQKFLVAHYPRKIYMSGNKSRWHYPGNEN